MAITTRMQRILERIDRDIPGGLVVAEDMLQNFADEGVDAAKFYEKFHWGNQPDNMIAAAAPTVQEGEILTALGPLIMVTYEATKGRGKPAWWEHSFEDQLPVLAYTQAGRLVIVGGSYTVNRRGIVG